MWAPEEYAKLPQYDAPTEAQPFATFMCHETPDDFCHGWAVCHTNRGNEFDLLALRMRPFPTRVPPAAVPLFTSGTEAAAHGLKDVDSMSPEAEEAAEKLLRHHPRLRRVGDE